VCVCVCVCVDAGLMSGRLDVDGDELKTTTRKIRAR